MSTFAASTNWLDCQPVLDVQEGADGFEVHFCLEPKRSAVIVVMRLEDVSRETLAAWQRTIETALANTPVKERSCPLPGTSPATPTARSS